MTRTEAITILKNAAWLGTDEERDRVERAVSEIEKWMTTSKTLDVISRQAAIEALNRMKIYRPLDSDRYVISDCLNKIVDLPSAQPETGKWIDIDCDEDKYDIIKCPCCKHTFTVDSYRWTDIGFVKDDFKFCPNCGVDMRGDHDERFNQ